MRIRSGGGFSGGVGGGFGLGGSSCYGPNCGQSGILSTLAVLNSQDAVRQAVDYGGVLPTMAATQSAQRSSLAAAYGGQGSLGYLANQQTWDRAGVPYWGR